MRTRAVHLWLCALAPLACDTPDDGVLAVAQAAAPDRVLEDFADGGGLEDAGRGPLAQKQLALRRRRPAAPQVAEEHRPGGVGQRQDYRDTRLAPGHVEPATALLGGIALYLLAHVAFRWRNVHRFSTQRVVAAIVLVALIPVAVEVPALATLGIATGVLVALIAWETLRFAELRERLRHQVDEHPA